MPQTDATIRRSQVHHWLRDEFAETLSNRDSSPLNENIVRPIPGQSYPVDKTQLHFVVPEAGIFGRFEAAFGRLTVDNMRLRDLAGNAQVDNAFAEHTFQPLTVGNARSMPLVLGRIGGPYTVKQMTPGLLTELKNEGATSLPVLRPQAHI